MNRQELAHILRAACRITVDQDVPVNSRDVHY